MLFYPFRQLLTSTQTHITMHITRLYADEAGETRFEDLAVSLEDAGPIGRLSEQQPATGVIFRETSGDYDYSWHHAPQRQYIIMLDGMVDVETSLGEKRRFSTGDVLLVEDTHGKGHRSTAVDGQPRLSLFITLD